MVNHYYHCSAEQSSPRLWCGGGIEPTMPTSNLQYNKHKNNHGKIYLAVWLSVGQVLDTAVSLRTVHLPRGKLITIN